MVPLSLLFLLRAEKKKYSLASDKETAVAFHSRPPHQTTKLVVGRHKQTGSTLPDGALKITFSFFFFFPFFFTSNVARRGCL